MFQIKNNTNHIITHRAAGDNDSILPSFDPPHEMVFIWLEV